MISVFSQMWNFNCFLLEICEEMFYRLCHGWFCVEVLASASLLQGWRWRGLQTRPTWWLWAAALQVSRQPSVWSSWLTSIRRSCECALWKKRLRSELTPCLEPVWNLLPSPSSFLTGRNEGSALHTAHGVRYCSHRCDQLSCLFLFQDRNSALLESLFWTCLALI